MASLGDALGSVNYYLPSGTLLAFIALISIIIPNGDTCESYTFVLAMVTIGVFSLACFIFSFTDSSDDEGYFFIWSPPAAVVKRHAEAAGDAERGWCPSACCDPLPQCCKFALNMPVNDRPPSLTDSVCCVVGSNAPLPPHVTCQDWGHAILATSLFFILAFLTPPVSTCMAVRPWVTVPQQLTRYLPAALLLAGSLLSTWLGKPRQGLGFAPAESRLGDKAELDKRGCMAVLSDTSFWLPLSLYVAAITLTITLAAIYDLPVIVFALFAAILLGSGAATLTLMATGRRRAGNGNAAFVSFLVSTAANVSYYLPTGALLTFTPLITLIIPDGDACAGDTNTTLILAVITVALFLAVCVAFSFTDSYTSSTSGATRYFFFVPTQLPDLLHALLAATLFGVFAVLTPPFSTCIQQKAALPDWAIRFIPAGLAGIAACIAGRFGKARHGLGFAEPPDRAAEPLIRGPKGRGPEDPPTAVTAAAANREPLTVQPRQRRAGEGSGDGAGVVVGPRIAPTVAPMLMDRG